MQLLRSNFIWPLLLLPVFFTLHGYVEFFPIIELTDAIYLCLVYIGIGLILSAGLRLIFQNWDQAHLMSLALLCLEFFFGAVQDTIRSMVPDSAVNRYVMLVPLLAIVVIAIGIVIRRAKMNQYRLNRFLVITWITLIAWDTMQMIFFKENPRPTNVLSADSMSQADNGVNSPDIYLIIADAYPGASTLNTIFKRPNDAFYQKLRTRGFFVADSAYSNYNFTEFSTASLLHMNYLRKIEGRQVSLKHLGYCFETMKQSPFIQFIQNKGYKFDNFSIFDFYGNPSPVIPTLLPGRTKPITEQTLTARIRKDIGYHFFTDIPLMAEWFGLEWAAFRNNNKITQLTLAGSKAEKNRPTFTYTHVMMPHVPYYYDRSGMLLKKPIQDARDTTAFFDYLEYTNNQLLTLIDSILLNAKRPTAILLIGDHGHRDYNWDVPTENHFKTLSSVLLPDRNYREFYPTISHVNLLRATANSLFDTKLPYLKDSSVFLTE